MKKVASSDSISFQHGTITTWEYDTPSDLMNIARIKINGRYPETGYTRNNEVDSILYVSSGNGVALTQDGREIILGLQDQLHIARGDIYAIEGDLEILYAATPKWTPDQTEHVE